MQQVGSISQTVSTTVKAIREMDRTQEEYNAAREIYWASGAHLSYNMNEKKNLEIKKIDAELAFTKAVRAKEELRRQLETLEDQYAALALELHYVQGKSVREIAYIIKKPKFYVRRVLRLIGVGEINRKNS